MKIFGYEMGKKNPKEGYDYFGIYPILNKHGIKEPILLYLKEEESLLVGARIIISANSFSKHQKHLNIIIKKLIKNGMIEQSEKNRSEVGERGVEKTIYMENQTYKIVMHYFEENIPSQKTGYTFNMGLILSKK